MMKMKLVDATALIRDPHTKTPLTAEGAEVPESNFWTRRWLDGETWRLDGDHWVRRLPDGKLVREPAAKAVDEAFLPVGNEPVAPLTTRHTKPSLKG